MLGDSANHMHPVNVSFPSSFICVNRWTFGLSLSFVISDRLLSFMHTAHLLSYHISLPNSVSTTPIPHLHHCLISFFISLVLSLAWRRVGDTVIIVREVRSSAADPHNGSTMLLFHLFQ